MRAFSEQYPQAFFIEIGANDGEQHDHLRPFIGEREWSGVMVEPVPYVFDRLRRNYAGVPGVVLERAAIAGRDGELPFYHLREAAPSELETLPDFYDGIGSFSRDQLVAHAGSIPDIESRIVRSEVECLTFESLCRKHEVERIDLLLIDAEGYDAEIIAGIDLDSRRPRLLVYEHYHLVPAERRGCREALEAAGYEILEEGFDTWCLEPRPDRLTSVWRSLEPAVAGVSAHDPG